MLWPKGMFTSFVFNDYDTELAYFWKNMNTKNVKKHFKSTGFYQHITLLEAIGKLTLNEKEDLNSLLDLIARNNLTFNGQPWGIFTQSKLEQNWNQNKLERILECNRLQIMLCS